MFSSSRIKSDGDKKISRSLNMIKLFYQNRDYATAKNYVSEVLSMKPDCSEAYKMLSQINEALGEHDVAMSNYKKALELKSAASDLNASFENNNHQFSPAKLSSPLALNQRLSNTSAVTPQGNHVVNHQMASVSIDDIEKLLERKMAAMEKNCQSINQHIIQLNDNLNKNCAEVSLIKKVIGDMQQKLILFGSKQEELSSMQYSLSRPSKSDEEVKEQLRSFSTSLGRLSEDNSKIIGELYNLKETVMMIYEKGNMSDYDEEGSYNDYDDNEDDNKARPIDLAEKPQLGQLFKKADKDSWKCSTCETYNSNADPACVCCETPNPNASKSLVNGTGGQETSQFKFGAPSLASSGFSFGSPLPKPNTPSSTFPTFPVNSSNIFSATSAPPASKPMQANTFTAPSTTPVFGNFGATSTASSQLPAKSIAPTSASPFSGVASFGNSSSSLLGGLTACSPATSKPTTSTASPFSFSGTFNLLNAANQNSPSKPATGTFSFGTLASNTNAPVALPATSLATSPFNLSAKFATQNASVSTATATTVVANNTSLFSNGPTSSFSFSSPTAANSAFSSTSKPAGTGNFSFGNISFNSNLFGGRQPTVNSPDKEVKSQAAVSTNDGDADEGYENGADNAQDGDYFKLPDVKLPEKYDQVTGEENEETVFERKAKLYIFKEAEYKERGIGVIKILKHRQTQKYRVLMRRDHVFKVCLNAHISDLTKLELADGKFLRFSCIDFSEGKAYTGVYLLKFGDVSVLPEFKLLVESLQNDNQSITAAASETANDSVVDPTEVELVFTKEPKPEHLDTINRLKLPPNFFDYENKVPCKGCIGCKVDSINFNDLTREDTDNTDAGQSAAKLDLGLFSSIATDLNVTEHKIDTIANDDTIENDHMQDKNFVSEKSKLLPENFEVKTGEEDEEIIFNERAKIYHYVNNEWKERGVGNMKILKRKDANAFRLLMRRDKILNVICNHVISDQLKLGPFQNSNNTLTWFARDYSEEADGLDEVFALKFKNETLMNQFDHSVKECIQKTAS